MTPILPSCTLLLPLVLAQDPPRVLLLRARDLRPFPFCPLSSLLWCLSCRKSPKYCLLGRLHHVQAEDLVQDLRLFPFCRLSSLLWYLSCRKTPKYCLLGRLHQVQAEDLVQDLRPFPF